LGLLYIVENDNVSENVNRRCWLYLEQFFTVQAFFILGVPNLKDLSPRRNNLSIIVRLIKINNIEISAGNLITSPPRDLILLLSSAESNFTSS